MKPQHSILIIAALMLVSCSNQSSKQLHEAKELIKSGKAECVLICSDGTLIQEQGRGLSPILKIFDTHPEAMKGAVVVDKVIGRAAAMVAINGQAGSVYGELISEDAVELLQKHGIEVSYNQLVHRILNRNRDGLCPLEQSVFGIDDPVEALAAARKRIEELSAGAQNKK